MWKFGVALLQELCKLTTNMAFFQPQDPFTFSSFPLDGNTVIDNGFTFVQDGLCILEEERLPSELGLIQNSYHDCKQESIPTSLFLQGGIVLVSFFLDHLPERYLMRCRSTFYSPKHASRLYRRWQIYIIVMYVL